MREGYASTSLPQDEPQPDGEHGRRQTIRGADEQAVSVRQAPLRTHCKRRPFLSGGKPLHAANVSIRPKATVVRQRSSIARPSHPICAASQLMCVGNGHLLCVGRFIIARRCIWHSNALRSTDLVTATTQPPARGCTDPPTIRLSDEHLRQRRRDMSPASGIRRVFLCMTFLDFLIPQP